LSLPPGPHEALTTRKEDGQAPSRQAPRPGVERLFENKWAAPLLLMALALLIFAVYYPTINAAFQLDDDVWIVKNPVIKTLANLPAMLRAQRGLTMLSLALNYATGGLDPRGYHLVNILIHIANAVLVYLLVFRTFILTGLAAARARLLGLCTATVFSLHPVQTEAVSYVVQRMESMSALFTLLALLAFIRASSASVTRRYTCYALTALAYVAAFYSKETAITTPALILLYDLFFVARGSSAGLLKKWPLYAVLAVLSLFFVVNTVAPLGGFNDVSQEALRETAPSSIQTTTGGKNRYASLPALRRMPTAGFGVTAISPYQYFLTESNVILYYYALLLLPLDQNIDYDFPVSTGLFERPSVHPGTRLLIPLPPPIVSLIIHACILALGLYLFVISLKRKMPRAVSVSFFIFWFFIILSPTSSFIPIVDVVFEHRLYLASLSYAVLLTLLLEKMLLNTRDREHAMALSKKH